VVVAFRQVQQCLKVQEVAGYSGHAEKGHIFLTLWNMEHIFAGQVDVDQLINRAFIEPLATCSGW